MFWGDYYGYQLVSCQLLKEAAVKELFRVPGNKVYCNLIH